MIIIGGGESGLGAALLASQKGYDVFLSDAGVIDKEIKNLLIDQNIPFEERGHTLEKFVGADFIVRSPGVPGNVPVLVASVELNIPVISEIEFGYRHYSGYIIGITGSNGKTTTTGLTYHILSEAGIPVSVGGNFGTSFCRILAERSDKPVMVLELSSFQLEDIKDFRPSVAMILNVTADHLDRYGNNIRSYAGAKFQITRNLRESDLFIYNADDPLIMEMTGEWNISCEKLPVRAENYENGIWSKDLDTYFDIGLPGKHNLFNAYCAISAARNLEVPDIVIQSALKTFRNQAHRMEYCGEIDDVRFYNDSKATNVDAVQFALEAFKESIVWIAGGTDKGNDYSLLIPKVSARVKTLICLGLDNTKLKSVFASVVDVIEETQSMEDAVKKAFRHAEKGAVVLLSPACASFDLFENYEDRGRQFKNAVEKLKSEKEEYSE
ncbi:MAG TPA: UDP-N-acetylmuramoyl-L-alanine--D-glutamate ligase [Saprospiraceae bacterium]|nr:UDP-N-acetylmuramoyl-L-alanine--D-glutamate ligase [Saprospiraceae bacterium]